ncbi:MAG: ATP-binding protein [Rhodanobacteraceae bacterium]
MRDLAAELKLLRLHGMAVAWDELTERGAAETEAARWLLEHLLQAETTDRSRRSVEHQLHAARFPIHRDLAGFDFTASPVDRKLIEQLAGMAFTESAHNVVVVGGPGTGKTQVSIAARS